MVSRHMYMVINPGVKNEPSLYPLIFFEDKPQNGGIDEAFVLFLDLFAAFAGKIVRVEKLKNIFNGEQFTGPLLSAVVFDNGRRKKGQLHVFQLTDKQACMFNPGRLEQRTVEIGER